MDEQYFNKIKNEYNSFEKELNDNIKSKLKIIKHKEGFLIKENWYNEFSNILKESKNEKNQFNQTKKFLSTKKPDFFNDIQSIINCLENNIQIKLVSSNLLKLIYKDENSLKSYKRVHYYAGNNKLLIEYMEQEKKETDALLIINLLEDRYNIYIFKIENNNSDKIKVYKELFAEDEINLNYFKENRNIEFKNEYTCNKNNSTNYKESNNNKSNSIQPFIKGDKSNNLKNNSEQNNNKKMNNNNINSNINNYQIIIKKKK